MSSAVQTPALDALTDPGTGDALTSRIERVREPQKLRNVELAFLIVAVLISAAALVLVQLGATGGFDWTIIVIASGIAILALGVHITLRFIAPRADPFLLPIATLLNGIGIAMIYRLDIAGMLADPGNNEGHGGALRQIMWTAIAIALALVVLVFLRNYRVLVRYRYICMVSAIILLILPLLPGIGNTEANARVWINIGPMSFQPGEVAKILLAIFFAGYLMEARDSLSIGGRRVLGIQFPPLRALGPLLIIWAAAMGVLVFQRDLGTSLLYFGLFLVMVYVATNRVSWIIMGIVLFVGGAVIAANTLDYVHFRMLAWLQPFDQQIYEAVGGSWQLVTGLFGMGAGGLIGQGLGQGMPYKTALAESDFIFASLGEELGLAGLFAILGLYLLFVSRAFRIGFRGRDDFGRLLSVGLGFTVALQVFIVAGGVTRVIPLTGLTMPFMAAGGSSLLANWIITAILLRLSDTVSTSAIEEVRK